MTVGEAQRLRELEDENGRLKRLVADLSLDKQMLKAVIEKTDGARRAPGGSALAVGPFLVSLAPPYCPESFAIRLKGKAKVEREVWIETTTLLETKEFCGAAWPSKVLKGKERNS
jgi:hypothetical protein